MSNQLVYISSDTNSWKRRKVFSSNSKGANRTTIKSRFVEVTGAGSTEASNWLEEYEWKLEEAIDAYTRPVKKVQKIDGRLEGIFDKYKEKEDGNKIDVEGTIAYLEDLGISPEDMESLSLSFFLKSPSMGCFDRDNFLKRWQEVGAFTLEAMKEYIKRYNEKVKNSESLYYEMYNFAFDFLMTVEGQNS